MKLDNVSHSLHGHQAGAPCPATLRIRSPIRKVLLTTVSLSIVLSPMSARAGGYVPLPNGAPPIKQANSIQLGSGAGSVVPTYNNATLTDKNTISETNNNVVKTPHTADPVSTVTGNNFHDETDFLIKGRGINYAFTRTYNSAPSSTSVNGLLGYGWTHSYAMNLKSNDYGACPNCTSPQAPENGNGKTSSITYTDERGGAHNYLVNESTYAISPPQGEFDNLAFDTPSSGQETLTFRNGTRYIFQTVGSSNIKTAPGVTARLIQIVDPWNNQLNFNYDASGRLSKVTDNLGISGRTGLTFSYDANGKLSTIKDWTNRTWSYVVDANGNLTSYTSAQAPTIGATYTYGYGSGAALHNLLTITKPLKRNGVSVTTTFAYYENGRTFNYQDSLGDVESLDYDLFRNTTRVTDPRGNVREYEYDSSGRMTQLNEPDGGILPFQNTTSDGLRYSKKDALGYQTQYSYRQDKTFGSASDTGGNVTREQDAFNDTIDTTYGPYDQIASLKDKRGNTVSTSYFTSNDGSCGVVGKPNTVSISSLTVSPGTTKTNVPLRSYCWNNDGTIKSQTDYLDPSNVAHTRVTSYTYTDATDLNVDHTATVGWDGLTITRSYTYDTLGRKKTETLKRRTSSGNSALENLTTSYTYDNMDRVTLVQDPIGNQVAYNYDDNGQIWNITDHYLQSDGSYESRSRVTRTFDAADRVQTEKDYYGDQTQYQYDASGNLIASVDANGHTTKYEYDAMNRRTAIVNGNGARSTITYDLRGDIVATTDATNLTTSYQYDALGRRTQTSDPHGYVTIYQYDPNGNLTCTIDANAQAGLQPKNSDGCSETRVYDELNRVTLVRDALNGTTATTYDLLGNPLTQIDAEGRLYQWGYDGLGRLKTETDFMGKNTAYLTDEAGNVYQKTDRLGQVTRFNFDGLNRLEELIGVGDDQVFTFFPDGTLEGYSSTNSGTMGATYDKLKRLLSKTQGGKTLSFTYDKVGNILTKSTFEGSVTSYTYDSANRLVNMSNPDYVSVDYEYDAAGRVLSRATSNGAHAVYMYDGAGWLNSLKGYDAGANQLVNLSYGRDRLGHITSIAMPTSNTTYVLDALYRLTTVTAPTTGNSEHFTYDHIGNRLTYTRGGTAIGASGSTTKYYVYTPATQTGAVSGYTPSYDNRLKEVDIGSVGGTVDSTFVFDDEGQLKTQTGTAAKTVTWDGVGRLRTLSISGRPQEVYSYDAFGHRTARTGGVLGNLSYFLEDDNIESVYSGSSLQERYFRGTGVDELIASYTYQSGALTPNLYQQDQLTSVVGASKPNGGSAEGYTYWAFGEMQTATGTQVSRLKYTGREDDGTGLYQYRARFYDPSIGRFISEDPKKFAAGINLYAYAGNDPIDLNDPSGQLVESSNPLGVLAGLAILAGGDVLAAGRAAVTAVRTYFAAESAASTAAALTGTKAAAGFAMGYAGAAATGTDSQAGKIGAGVVGAVVVGYGGAASDLIASKLNIAKSISTVVVSGTAGSAAEIGAQAGDMVSGNSSEGFNWSKIGVAGLTTAGVSLLGGEAWIAQAAANAEGGAAAFADILGAAHTTVGTIATGNISNSLLFPTASTSSGSFESGSGSPAAGGYLIYPNMPNNNGIAHAYSK